MPQRHHQSDLDGADVEERVSVRNQDTLTWFRHNQAFTIISIQKEGSPVKGAPDNPFFREPPIPSDFEDGARGRHVVNSGPAKREAIGQHYRAVFQALASAQAGDPHFVVDP